MLIHTTENLISIPDSLLLSLVGFSVVFIALIALIAVIKSISGLSSSKKNGVQAASDQPEIVSPLHAAAEMIPASGSLGEIELYDVDDYSAALIMAIVADKMEVPLNTLRFKSIKQIEERR